MILENSEKIKKVLENDGVIAYVTDTVWGLGCLPTSQKAVQKIYEIKKREAQKPLILMSNETYNLLEYVQPIPKNRLQTYKKIFSGCTNTRHTKKRKNSGLHNIKYGNSRNSCS